MTRSARPRLTRDATVLALVPHYRCEEWLADCLESLLEQSRSLDGIVVLDDASAEPPLEIVRRFPGVTLLAAEENSGPYRLIQAAIERTRYDAYLFNDADDWSARDRLEILLAAAEATGAELIGSQEVRILTDEVEALTISYPVDVNAALREQPRSFALLHPTSLVARSLVMRLGGFATGLRFSGDAEFLHRAGHAARVVNVPEHLYFRRHRAGALTTAPETGLESAARRQVHERLWNRAVENAERVAAGRAPDLRPLSQAEPLRLSHLHGPFLRAASHDVPELAAAGRPPC
jgi:glycosyltransferase involved in cell wall biosynthesis